DFWTRHILLRCDSSGDLYPVTKPSTIPTALLGTNALVIPDFWTRHILLRCDSSGDLYPVTKPSTIPTALFSTSSATWHQRLGHPDIFTKGLLSALFEDFRSSLSVRLPPARTARATSGLIISSFDVIVPEISIPSTIPTALFSTSSSTWHQRLGHPGDKVIRSLASRQFISCNKEKSSHVCHACQRGKHEKLPFHTNFKMLESLMKDYMRQTQDEGLQRELEYSSEDYDEEIEAEPRPSTHGQTRPTLRIKPSLFKEPTGKLTEAGVLLQPPIASEYVGNIPSVNQGEIPPNGMYAPFQTQSRKPFFGGCSSYQPFPNHHLNAPTHNYNYFDDIPIYAPLYNCLYSEPIGSATPFARRIEDYPLPDGLKMSTYIGSYTGKGDPDNFLHLFDREIRMQKWVMPVACHMFTYTLRDYARIWWTSKKLGSIVNYDDLKAKFRSHFNHNKKFTKTHLERILGFVHGLKTRSLVEFFTTDLPTTNKALIKKTYTWIKAKKVAVNGAPVKYKEARGNNRDMSKYCQFYKDHGHEIGYCRELKRQIKEAYRALERSSFGITIGEGNRSTKKALNFVIVMSDSSYNLLLGRTTMQKMAPYYVENMCFYGSEDDLKSRITVTKDAAPYYVENMCFYGSEDDLKSRITVTKDAGNMSVEDLVSWAKEEAAMANKASDVDIFVTSVLDKGKADRKTARSRNNGIVIRENVNPSVSKDDDSDSDIELEQRFKGSAELEEMYKVMLDSESEYSDKCIDYLSEDTVIEHEEYMDTLMHQLRGEDDDSDSDIELEQRFKGSAELEEMYKVMLDSESEYSDKCIDYLSEGKDELISLRKRKNTVIEHEEYMDTLMHQLRELLGEDIDIPTGNGLTLISNQHKAVKDVIPLAEHRQCARHIYEGFRMQYSRVEFRELFWAASKASYPQLFNKIMQKIKKANPGAHEGDCHGKVKFWHVIPAGGNLFKVRIGSEAFRVDEHNRTCTCRMWQLLGLGVRKVTSDGSPVARRSGSTTFVRGRGGHTLCVRYGSLGRWFRIVDDTQKEPNNQSTPLTHQSQAGIQQTLEYGRNAQGNQKVQELWKKGYQGPMMLLVN
nr:ribonuclease H-like domain-containing protein [Tanacetum cinerariifolium]